MVCQVKQERGNVEVVPTEAELVPRLSNPAIQSAFKVQPAAAGVSDQTDAASISWACK